MTRSKATKSNSTSRAVILGCLGLGVAGVCLGVVGVGAFMATRIRPVTEQMPLGNLPILVNLVDPTDGRGVALKTYTAVHSEAIGSNPITAIQLWVDGIPVDAHAAGPSATGTGSAVDFSWQPATYGQHVLLARAVDSSGQTVNSNLVRVNAAGPTSIPKTFLTLADAGDTLTTLADQQGLTADQLQAFNPGIDPNQPLTQDQPITVPVFTPPASLLDGPATAPVPPDMSLVPPVPDPPNGPTTPADEAGPSPVLFWMGDNFPIVFGNPAPPAAPQLAVKVDGCKVHLYISDKATDESGFFVYRLKPNANNFERIATLNANSGANPVEYVNDGLFGMSQYYVTAFNPAGESASNLVGPQVEQASCLEPEQKGLGLDNAKIKVAQPVEQLYCYAAFDNGPWRRLPSKPDTFITPLNGEFDLSPYFNLLASPAPSKTAPLDMECWGWQNGALNNLGKVQYMFKVNEGGPVQIPGPGFILDGISNPNLVTLPTLNVADFKPHVVVPSADGKKIAAPFDLLTKVMPETSQVQIVWDWLPVTCLVEGDAGTAPDCHYVKDIDGYKVYDGASNLLTTIDTMHKTATLPLGEAKLIPSQCFQVVAFKDALESDPTSLACVDAPAPTPPLPSAQISAPYKLAITNDPADCRSHLPTAFSGFLTAVCDGANATKDLLLTWNWQAGGCFPPPAGQPPACEILSDIDGFHIYRATLNGSGELVETVNNPLQTLVILPPVPAVVNCYLVQAFKGGIESGPSNTFCATFGEQGLTQLTLTPSQGAGFGQLYDQKNCGKDFWFQLDFPADSFTNPPADLALNVGAIHKHYPACDRTMAIWYEGMVGFDLSNLKDYSIQKASFIFNSGSSTNLSGGESSLADLADASKADCATGLVKAEGYTPGTSLSAGGTASNLGGSMWVGSEQIAAGPFGGHQIVEVTDWVNQALAQGKSNFNLIFTADQTRPDSTSVCLSTYKDFSLTLQLGPK